MDSLISKDMMFTVESVTINFSGLSQKQRGRAVLHLDAFGVFWDARFHMKIFSVNLC